MDSIENLELLLQIKSSGQENLRVTQDLITKLGSVVNSNSKLFDDFTRSIQGQTAAVKQFANEATQALSDFAKRGVEQAAQANKNAAEKIIADNERVVKSFERRAAIAGQTGLQRLQTQNQGVLADFKGSEEQVNRLKAAFGQLEEAQNRQSSFAGRLRAWVTAPLYEAGKAAEGVATALGTTGLVLGGTLATIAAVGVGTVKLANSLAETSREFINFSLRTGLSVRASQEFIGASQLAGVNAFSLESSVRKLGEAMAEGGLEGKKSAELLQRLGIEAYTSAGQLRPMDEILREIFSRLNDVKNPADRATIALGLLGRSGRELLPLIGNLDSFISKARETGVVIGDEGITKADHYRKSVELLSEQWSGLVNALKQKAVGVIEFTGLVKFLGDTAQNFSLSNFAAGGPFVPGHQ